LGVKVDIKFLKICQIFPMKITDIIKNAKRSVVAIGFTFSPQGIITPEEIAGSGFIISKERYICTCAHVVLGRQGQLRVSIYGGGNYPHALAEIILIDQERDIAILRVPPPPPHIQVDFVPVELGDSDTVKEGQEVLFIGFPFGGGTGGGFTASSTKGMIAAIRPKQIGDEIINHFQLDAMTMEGNSGAPLIDIESGKVIGIINARFDPLFNGNIPKIIVGGRPLSITTNIGFAIPINLVKPIINAVLTKK
jgi:S1-C subfamily serine protease